MLEIADEADGQSIQRAFFKENSVKIQQRLRGVLVGTVPGIDNGDIGGTGEGGYASVARVPYGDDIRIAAQDAAHVLQTLAFLAGTGSPVLNRGDLSAQSQHGRFERQAGAGAGLEK